MVACPMAFSSACSARTFLLRLRNFCFFGFNLQFAFKLKRVFIPTGTPGRMASCLPMYAEHSSCTCCAISSQQSEDLKKRLDELINEMTNASSQMTLAAKTQQKRPRMRKQTSKQKLPALSNKPPEALARRNYKASLRRWKTKSWTP